MHGRFASRRSSSQARASLAAACGAAVGEWLALVALVTDQHPSWARREDVTLSRDLERSQTPGSGQPSICNMYGLEVVTTGSPPASGTPT